MNYHRVFGCVHASGTVPSHKKSTMTSSPVLSRAGHRSTNLNPFASPYSPVLATQLIARPGPPSDHPWVFSQTPHSLLYIHSHVPVSAFDGFAHYSSTIVRHSSPVVHLLKPFHGYGGGVISHQPSNYQELITPKPQPIQLHSNCNGEKTGRNVCVPKQEIYMHNGTIVLNRRHGGGRRYIAPRMRKKAGFLTAKTWVPKEKCSYQTRGADTKQNDFPDDAPKHEGVDRCRVFDGGRVKGVVAESVSVAQESVYDDVEDSIRGKTTIMIRNIPNQFGRRDLLDILDTHCREVNEELARRGEHHQSRSEYDFVYLPIDYANKVNKGYAFVNFTNERGALRMCRAYHNFKWEGHNRLIKSKFKSKKVCEISCATIQGRAELEANFQSRIFPCVDFQPVATRIPRDGTTIPGDSTESLILVGKVQVLDYGKGAPPPDSQESSSLGRWKITPSH